MKSTLLKSLLTILLFILAVPAISAQTTEEEEANEEGQTVSTIAVDPAVVVTMCLESGNVVIAGGDRREVRVTAMEPGTVSLRPTEVLQPTGQATRVEVVVTKANKKGRIEFGECRGTSDIDLEVPRGSTVYVKTRDGDIEISNVMEVRAESSTGSIGLRKIARAVEASTVNGDISLEDSSGRIRLKSISGSIAASRAKVIEPNDFLYSKTISGDIALDEIEQARVEAGTISGEVSMSGSLAPGGFYDFLTTTGDITLAMPTNVSFQLTAIVSQGGEVITDFPLKYKGGISSLDAMSSGKLSGSYGTGQSAATINLASFSGTLRLQKR